VEWSKTLLCISIENACVVPSHWLQLHGSTADDLTRSPDSQHSGSSAETHPMITGFQSARALCSLPITIEDVDFDLQRTRFSASGRHDGVVAAQHAQRRALAPLSSMNLDRLFVVSYDRVCMMHHSLYGTVPTR